MMREDIIHDCVMEWIDNHTVNELFHVLTDCTNCPVINCYDDDDLSITCVDLLDMLDLDCHTIAMFNKKYLSEADDINLYSNFFLCEDCVCYNNCDSSLPCYDNIERWIKEW